MRGAHEGGGIGAGGPDRGPQEAEEGRCVVGGVEVEVDDDVVGVVNRPLDALLAYPGLLAGLGEAAERGVPRVEVGDGMFDVQGGHGVSRLSWAAVRSDARRAGRSLPIPGTWGLRVAEPSRCPGSLRVASRHDQAGGIRAVGGAGRADLRVSRGRRGRCGLRLLEEIRRAVSFDAYAWLLTDPETSVGSAPLADVPCLPELPRLIRPEVPDRDQPVDVTAAAPVALLHEATGGDLSLSLLWRDLQSPLRRQ